MSIRADTAARASFLSRLRLATEHAKVPFSGAAIGNQCGGIDRRTVERWIKGTGSPSPMMLFRLADGLGVDARWLATAEGEMLAGKHPGAADEESEALKRLRIALPDWRRYVLGLAMVENQEAQRVLLDTMRQAVPDRRVEKFVTVAPHAAARQEQK